MAFDVKITTKKNIYWADVTDIPKLLNDQMLSVPIFSKGTFD